jgi:hypothetical protein
MTEVEKRIAFLIKQAFDEWDSIHGDGWNEPYLKLVPTVYHQAARTICEEFGLTARPVQPSP